MEFSTVIPASSALYGLGERSSSTGVELRRDGIPLALWNHDSPAAAPDQNVYGSHPILMEVREGEDPVLGNLCLCCIFCSTSCTGSSWCLCAAVWSGRPNSGVVGCRKTFPPLHWLLPFRTRSLPCSAVACRVRTRLWTANSLWGGGGGGCCADSTARCCPTGTARRRLLTETRVARRSGCDSRVCA